MECTFRSSSCSSGVSIASLFSTCPPPPLSSFSLFCCNLSTFPFFSPMPRPYLSILSPTSFRRHFSSSSPVAHPGVTRFSVAGGRRQKVSGGNRRSQEVTDDTRTQTHCTVHLVVTSHLVFKKSLIFLTHSHPSPWWSRSDIWLVMQTHKAAFHKWLSCLSVSHADHPHASPAVRARNAASLFDLLTSEQRVNSSNSERPPVSMRRLPFCVCLSFVRTASSKQMTCCAYRTTYRSTATF